VTDTRTITRDDVENSLRLFVSVYGMGWHERVSIEEAAKAIFAALPTTAPDESDEAFVNRLEAAEAALPALPAVRCGYGCNREPEHEGVHLMPSAGIYPAPPADAFYCILPPEHVGLHAGWEGGEWSVKEHPSGLLHAAQRGLDVERLAEALTLVEREWDGDWPDWPSTWPRKREDRMAAAIAAAYLAAIEEKQ
jgi:hypothetical protein